MRHKKLVIGSFLALVVLVVTFPLIEDGLTCLAYYDHCTAEEVEGLTNEQCMERADSVAYLHERNVCLVKRQE